MSGIKQKNRVRQQRKRVQQHKRSMLGISAVIMLLVMVVSVSSISLQARNKEYIAQEKELEASIREEKDRAEEISELEDYVGTDEYIEQTAKDKLGLVHKMRSFSKPGRMDALRSAQTEISWKIQKIRLREEIPEAYQKVFLPVQWVRPPSITWQKRSACSLMAAVSSGCL